MEVTAACWRVGGLYGRITVEDVAFDNAAAMVTDESVELAADRKVRAAQVIAALVADFLGSR